MLITTLWSERQAWPTGDSMVPEGSRWERFVNHQLIAVTRNEPNPDRINPPWVGWINYVKVGIVMECEDDRSDPSRAMAAMEKAIRCPVELQLDGELLISLPPFPERRLALPLLPIMHYEPRQTTSGHARRQLDALVRELGDRWERRIAGLESRGKHWSAPTKKRADEVRCCLTELRTEIAKLPNAALCGGEKDA